jgi:hypothetical protein
MSEYDFNKPKYLELFNEVLEETGAFADLPAQCQTRSILNSVANQTIDYAISSKSDDFRGLLFDALWFVQNMQKTLIVRENLKWLPSYERDDPKFNERVWVHKDCKLAIGSEESGHYWPINSEELMFLCNQYLEQPWINCGIIDWILVDALVYIETLGTGNQLKPTFLSGDVVSTCLEDSDSKRQLKIFFKHILRNLVVVSIIGVIVAFTLIEKHGFGVGFFAGIFLFALYKTNWIVNRQDNFDSIKEANRMLMEMLKVSAMMDLTKRPLSPKHLRERLRKAEDLGASWPPVIFPILDNAIARNSLISW